MPTRLILGNSIDIDGLFAPLIGLDRVGLAVSGGPDSLALMLLAADWAAHTQDAPQFVVYSVDHGLRAEAAEEAAMVAYEAEALGLPVRVLRWEGDKPATGISEAARIARYGLMRQAMAEDGVALLATAHHLGDQAETVLMRLAHGSGLDGLQGMDDVALVEGIQVARPLLGVERRDLEALVAASGLVPARDPSNLDPNYERVRWRNVMPQLAEMGLDAATLGLFAKRMNEANIALNATTSQAFESIVELDSFGAARFAHADFLALPQAIATRLLRRVLNIAGGRKKPRALGQIERLRDELNVGVVTMTTTMLGCIVRFDGDGVIVTREPGRLSMPRHALGPQSQVLWDDRFVVVNASADSGFSVGTMPHIERRKLSELLGYKVTSPAEAIRTAPIVRDGQDTILALGGLTFDDRVSVTLLTD